MSTKPLCPCQMTQTMSLIFFFLPTNLPSEVQAMCVSHKHFYKSKSKKRENIAAMLYSPTQLFCQISPPKWLKDPHLKFVPCLGSCHPLVSAVTKTVGWQVLTLVLGTEAGMLGILHVHVKEINPTDQYSHFCDSLENGSQWNTVQKPKENSHT